MRQVDLRVAWVGRPNKTLMISEADRLQLRSMGALGQHAAFVGAARADRVGCRVRASPIGSGAALRG